MEHIKIQRFPELCDIHKFSLQISKKWTASLFLSNLLLHGITQFATLCVWLLQYVPIIALNSIYKWLHILLCEIETKFYV